MAKIQYWRPRPVSAWWRHHFKFFYNLHIDGSYPHTEFERYTYHGCKVIKVSIWPKSNIDDHALCQHDDVITSNFFTTYILIMATRIPSLNFISIMVAELLRCQYGQNPILTATPCVSMMTSSSEIFCQPTYWSCERMYRVDSLYLFQFQRYRRCNIWPWTIFRATPIVNMMTSRCQIFCAFRTLCQLHTYLVWSS